MTRVPMVIAAILLSGAISVGEKVPPFELTNFDGQDFSNESLTGKTTILVPTYAKCVFACPLVTLFLVELDKQLGSPPSVQYVHVSVQPEEDSADEIRSHFEDHEIDLERDSRWWFLNGPPDEIRDFHDASGVEVSRTSMEDGIFVEHTVRVVVVGPDGDVLAEFDSYFWDEKEMNHALRYAIQSTEQ